MAGKGSSPRKVDLESYGKNYDSIFKKKKDLENEKIDVRLKEINDILKQNKPDEN